jgi:hypothetical protein
LALCFLSAAAAPKECSTGYPGMYTGPWMRPSESETSPERTNTKGRLSIYLWFI